MVQVKLVRSLLNLSRSLDFSSKGLMCHHQRVAYIALSLGQEVGLQENNLFDLFKASIIHDAGALSWREKLVLERFDVQNPWNHCKQGSAFVADIPTFSSLAPVILSHHDAWAGNNYSGYKRDQIPLLSRIIHLADRVDVLLKEGVYVLEQRDKIMKRIQALSGQVFDPDLVALLTDLSRRESFWLDLNSPWLNERLESLIPTTQVNVETEDLLHLGKLFARVVDMRSPFTYRHSNGVSLVGRFLAESMGFSHEEVELIQVAGLLHDLGKLAIPEAIIEKRGPLTKAEMNLMKQHTYYTYWLLKPITLPFPIPEWAAFHHERLDGQGYPFHKSATDLDTPARLLAVADIYTALREERPYRSSLSEVEIKRILKAKVADGGLDQKIIEHLLASYYAINNLWAQLSAPL